MAFDVTSYFHEEAHAQEPESRPLFYLSGTSSNYTDYVTKWPKIKRDWKDVRPMSITISLSNEDQTFNFFKEDPTHLLDNCTIRFGFQLRSLFGYESITLMTGQIDRVKYTNGQLQLSISDKLKPLSERVLGSAENTEYLGTSASGLVPSDLAWAMVTSFGGFSAIESTSNPDIDWEAFQDWAAVFSADNVLTQCEFTGQKITDGLRRLARMTRSAIFLKNDKLSFHRFTLSDTYTVEANYGNMYSSQITIDEKQIINRQYVNADYNTSSGAFGLTVIEEDSASVNSFGLHEEIEEDKNIWYTSSAAALNLAQRIIFTRAEPFKDVSIKTGMGMITRQIGETILFTDQHLQEGGNYYRIMGQEIDIHNHAVSLTMDATMIQDAFKLDFSAVDSTDVLL